jgi:hypothetical protein
MFQLAGDEEEGFPKVTPSIDKVIEESPISSEAFTDTGRVLDAVFPSCGTENETVGGLVSATVLLTTTATFVVVAVFPAVSLARALTVCGPFDVDMVFQDIE